MKNENLKKVQKMEVELRKWRDSQETDMLSTAALTQKEGLKWANNNLVQIKKQDDQLKAETVSLKEKMQKRQ